MLRHAGHLYISVRKFDKAIEALEGAATLIEGQENEIEPDGMPRRHHTRNGCDRKHGLSQVLLFLQRPDHTRRA